MLIFYRFHGNEAIQISEILHHVNSFQFHAAIRWNFIQKCLIDRHQTIDSLSYARQLSLYVWTARNHSWIIILGDHSP